MNITRRDALMRCFIITVGSAIIPSCVQEKTKPSIVLKNLKLDGDEEKMLTEICETIIPATHTPGAKDASIQLFVLKMVDDMYSKEEQQQFVNGMKAFDKMSKNKLDKSFVNAGAQQRQELLAGMMGNNNKDVPENVTGFLKTMKRFTVQGFTTSRYYLTKVRVYELVPGRFHGCVPVKASNQKELQNIRKEGQI